MKKLAIVLFSMFLFITNVQAKSANVAFTGPNEFTDTVTVEVLVKDYEDVSDIYGLSAKLVYDETKLEMTSIKALENLQLATGKKIAVYGSVGVKKDTKVLSITFKNKALQVNETTEIKLTDVVLSDGNEDISTTNINKTLKFTETTKVEENKKPEEIEKNPINNNQKEETPTINTGDNFNVIMYAGVMLISLAVLAVGLKIKKAK